MHTNEMSQNPPSDSIAAFRDFYARYITATAKCRHDSVRRAFATVPREHFVGPGPWQVALPPLRYVSTESADPRLVYQDILVGLVPDLDINNGEPSLHALCLDQCNPLPGETVVQVGAGTGYYTAILAHLVGTGGRVYAYELNSTLAARAKDNLRDVHHVEVRAQSALTALPKADVIYVCAGATYPPEEWLDALAIRGRMVLPLVPLNSFGGLLLLTKRTEDDYAAQFFSRAWYIPCVGAADDASSRPLAAAFQAGGQDQVRSLKRRMPVGESAWCAGSDWWLSTAE